MGQIVGAFATAHLVMKRGTGGAAGERVFEGLKAVGARVQALKPDVVVIVSSDHFYNYKVGDPRAFAVSAEAEHTPFGDMHIPQRPFRGAADFAEGLIAFAEASGLALDRLEGYRPDHGVVIPQLMIDAAGTTPTVPLIVNTGLHPPTPLESVWRQGEALGRYVREARPAAERTVVVAAGGLSHWLGVAEMGRINPDFDNAVLDAFTAGRAKDLLGWTSEQVLAEGGNGGLEILCWLLMAAAAPGAKGARLYYEAVPEWITGMGGLELYPVPVKEVEAA